MTPPHPAPGEPGGPASCPGDPAPRELRQGDPVIAGRDGLQFSGHVLDIDGPAIWVYIDSHDNSYPFPRDWVHLDWRRATPHDET